MNFENSDAIGVTVRKQDGTNHLTNQKFVYDGSLFSASDVYWYPKAEGASTVIAYYPYAETGLPGSFTVKSDQRASGYTLSDLLGAVGTDVSPALTPVELIFHHLLANVVITTEVPEGVTIDAITIDGFIPTVDANIEAQTVSVSTSTAATPITAHEITANTTYGVILPPQKVASMQIGIKTAAGVAKKTIANVTLLQGKQYTLQLKISKEEELIEASFSGEIAIWSGGGAIEQDMDGTNIIVMEPDTPSAGEAGRGLIYGDATYRTSVINGQEWMAENLRYKPEGASEHTDYRYPDNRESQAATLGILYNYRTAMAGASPVLNDEATVRGICPEGWRLPKIGELVELAKITGRSFFSDSGYFKVSDETAAYSLKRSYVMSSTQTDNEHVHYLRISNEGEKIIDTKSIPTANIFASIRCVRDAKDAKK